MTLGQNSKYDIAILGKIILTILCLVLTSFSVFGQSELSGKYTREDHPAGYIILDSDRNFKFRYKSHAYWDLACGKFEVKNDTIFFTYTSDMFDDACNNERINKTDTSDFFLRQGVDKQWRPIVAKIQKNKIQIIKAGSLNEVEVVGSNNYYYKRVKKRYAR